MEIFDFQEIKRVGQSFYILTIFIFLILRANINNYLTFIITFIIIFKAIF